MRETEAKHPRGRVWQELDERMSQTTQLQTDPDVSLFSFSLSKWHYIPLMQVRDTGHSF